MDDRLRLSELICARLCHDLSGLLGSLVGTLELVAQEDTGLDAMAIAIDTATAMAARLKLLRAAWAGLPQPLDLPGLATLTQGVTTTRISLNVAGLPPTAVFPPAVGCLVLNLLLLATESLPRGGVLHLNGEATDLIARLDGPNAAWPAGLAGMLLDPDSAWQALSDPRTLQAPLTALLARHHGLRLRILPAPDAPSLRLTAL
jgi:histidine phosphotransferase ChpT